MSWRDVDREGRHHGPGTQGSAGSIPDREIEALRQGLRGPLVRPGDEAYDAERLGFDLLVDPRPDLIVAATGTEDVAAAVRFAAGNGLPIAVKSTGHGPSGRSAGGLMISTSRMAHVRVDPEARTAWIAAGTRWGQVIQETVPAGLGPLSGSSPTVGAIGYISGGGHPLMGRAHGWAADHVRRAEIVTADGRVLTVSPEEDGDLFWAIRGGSGNFGVITGMEVDLFPVDQLFSGALIFPGEISPQVMQAYREWITDLPDEMNSSVAVMRLPDMPMIPEPVRGRFIASIRICYVGGEGRGAALVEPLRAIGDRVMDTVGPMPYTQSWTIHMDPQEPIPVMFVTAALSEFGEGAAEALLGAVGPGADTSLLLVEVRHLGGALARSPRLPDAVGHRDVPFNLFALSPVFPGMQEKVTAELEAVLQAAAPFDTGGVLLNFLGPGDGDPSRVRRAYEPEIYDRLADVKGAFDPANLFRLNHNIPPGGTD